jgi:chromosome segregation ATPase
MAKKTAPPTIDINAAITNALVEQEAIEQERSGLLAKIDQLQSELSSIHNDAPNRSQGREALKVQIATAQQAIEKQESYISLWMGNSGTQELGELKATMEQLLDRLHQAVQNDEQLAARCAELDAAIAKDRSDLAGLDRRISTVSAARQRLIHENATAIYEECHNTTSEREQRRGRVREELAAVEQEIVTAREASLQRLSPYPAERRRFEREHVASDATIEVLKAGILFFSTLVGQGHAAEQCQAGIPSSVISLLREFELDPATLRALASGDPHVLIVQRDRLISLLRDYLHKWTVAAS